MRHNNRRTPFVAMYLLGLPSSLLLLLPLSLYLMSTRQARARRKSRRQRPANILWPFCRIANERAARPSYRVCAPQLSSKQCHAGRPTTVLAHSVSTASRNVRRRKTSFFFLLLNVLATEMLKRQASEGRWQEREGTEVGTPCPRGEGEGAREAAGGTAAALAGAESCPGECNVM